MDYPLKVFNFTKEGGGLNWFQGTDLQKPKSARRTVHQGYHFCKGLLILLKSEMNEKKQLRHISRTNDGLCF